MENLVLRKHSLQTAKKASSHSNPLNLEVPTLFQVFYSLNFLNSASTLIMTQPTENRRFYRFSFETCFEFRKTLRNCTNQC